MADVRIDQVNTTFEVNDRVGPLSREEVQRIVDLVLERLRDQQNLAARLQEDRTIRNRSYVPDWERRNT